MRADEEQEEMVELGPGVQVDRYQADCVQVYADTPSALVEEFIRLSSDLAYWGSRYADALGAFLVAKQLAKTVRARVELETREALRAGAGSHVDEKGKPVKKERVTDAAVDAAVDTTEEVQEAELKLIKAEVARERIRGTFEALKAKKDMLVQLGAQYRAELPPRDRD